LLAELVERAVLFQRQSVCAIGRAQSQKHPDLFCRPSRPVLGGVCRVTREEAVVEDEGMNDSVLRHSVRYIVE